MSGRAIPRNAASGGAPHSPAAAFPFCTFSEIISYLCGEYKVLHGDA